MRAYANLSATHAINYIYKIWACYKFGGSAALHGGLIIASQMGIYIASYLLHIYAGIISYAYTWLEEFIATFFLLLP